MIDTVCVQLISAIGTGGYGVVCYALDCLYGLPVERAVKQLPCRGSGDQRWFQTQEISLHRHASSHPSIAHISIDWSRNMTVSTIMDYAVEAHLVTIITEKRLVDELTVCENSFAGTSGPNTT